MPDRITQATTAYPATVCSTRTPAARNPISTPITAAEPQENEK